MFACENELNTLTNSKHLVRWGKVDSKWMHMSILCISSLHYAVESYYFVC